MGGSWNPEKELCWHWWELWTLVEEFAVAQLAECSQGTDLPQFPPSHLSIPCQCPPQ